jgi:hypothetical protein
MTIYTKSEATEISEELPSLPDLTNKQLATLLEAARRDWNTTKDNVLTLEAHIDELESYLTDREESEDAQATGDRT